jgi:PncC family amidohydrolase
MKALENSLRKDLHALLKDLKKSRQRIVFAESCTGGLIASLLSEVPGVSDFFCGSQVVYRNDSKHSWLRVKRQTLKKYSAVSRETAREMCVGILMATPEAQVGAAITGYLGPKGKNVGQVFIAAMVRGDDEPTVQEVSIFPGLIHRGLSASTTLRLKRRVMGARLLIFLVRTLLK